MTHDFESIKKVDLAVLLEPGILKVVCNNTGRAFFWEAENVLREISQFQHDLINGTIDNPLLLQDYQNYGFDSFNIIVVVAGPQLRNKAQREAMLISIKNDWQGEFY